MIILDYFVYGIFRFWAYVGGKNKGDAKLMALMFSAMFIAFLIGTLSEAHIIYSGLSVDANFIKHEGERYILWSYLGSIIVLLLIYYIFRKNKLDTLDVKYQSFSKLRRNLIKWILILIYLLILVLSFLFVRYIEAVY